MYSKGNREDKSDNDSIEVQSIFWLELSEVRWQLADQSVVRIQWNLTILVANGLGISGCNREVAAL